jgi:hypothetical protein
MFLRGRAGAILTVSPTAAASDRSVRNAMARRFNKPPGWPPVPSPDWRPPPGWKPDPSWPAPPPGWIFYIDEPAAHGLVRSVPGPAATIVATLWVVFWLAVSSIGIFFPASCSSVRCYSRFNTAFPVMGIAQVSVLVLVVLCYLRRWRWGGLMLAVVGVPAVFIAYAVVAAAIIDAG